ncbi:glycosyltransferase [Leucobacter chromiiresistens]|uniref:4,4'-diaponeurosporenoate glycosyltransferase n=1 Tax=Leucobacter chromiiresistens TaxID=1079994 RepID=A0A1H0Y2U9_9MICO|nr:glycosyltransferase [Leucobacter chromiiresistens]SDQ09256.1 Glycosyltransferase involved in cell wall bisynthesis [Leucobacter chromiiresistens]
MQHVAVVIPAKNEERRIAACLSAVLAASARCPVDVSVTLVADGCTDRTVPLARSFAGVEVVEIAASNVGVGRALGVRHALRSLTVHPAGVWIANTDADSIVPSDWIAQQLLRAEAGVDAVLGSVVPDPAEYPRDLQQRWAHAHPAGRATPEIYGANLGVRASAYLRAGGFAALAEHEDVDLVRRLRAPRVRYSDASPVITSARLDGRTPGGFAGYLRAEREVEAPIVELS